MGTPVTRWTRRPDGVWVGYPSSSDSSLGPPPVGDTPAAWVQRSDGVWCPVQPSPLRESRTQLWTDHCAVKRSSGIPLQKKVSRLKRRSAACSVRYWQSYSGGYCCLLIRPRTPFVHLTDRLTFASTSERESATILRFRTQRGGPSCGTRIPGHGIRPYAGNARSETM